MQKTPQDQQLFREAQQALGRDDLSSARRLLESLWQRHRGDPTVGVLLAGVLMGQSALREATACLLATVDQLPPDAAAVARVARYLQQLGETNGARACLARPVPTDKASAAALGAIGSIWHALGMPEQASQRLQQAADLGFRSAELDYLRGVQLLFLGRLEEAASVWLACLREAPGMGRACLGLARLPDAADEQGDRLALAERAATRAQPDSDDRAAAKFARFELLHRARDHEPAWRALAAGNDIMARRVRQRPEQVGRLAEHVAAHCDAGMLGSPAQAAAPEGPQPVFIVGLPRSGSTLLERMLTNHSQVASAGELADFWRQLRWMADLPGKQVIDAPLLARCADLDFEELGRCYLAQTQWRAGQSRYYVDKLPANSFLVGLIHRALPHAPILRMQRGAMDVCWSNFKAMFGQAYVYSYDLANTSRYYQAHERLMTHWHQTVPGAMQDVCYENLVQDTQAEMQKVLAFCGLAMEPACLDPSRNTAPIASLSASQVREPLDTRGLGDWQPYAEHLQSLRDALA